MEKPGNLTAVSCSLPELWDALWPLWDALRFPGSRAFAIYDQEFNVNRKLKSEGSYVFEEVTKMKMDKSTVGKTPPQQKDAVDAVDAVDDENAADAVDTGDAVASVDTVATVDAVDESDGKKKSAQGEIMFWSKENFLLSPPISSFLAIMRH